MTPDPTDAVAAPDRDAGPQGGWRCGLNELGERCDNPPPPVPVDERGRRKGGKPPKFCGKPHTDRAAQLRRRADRAITDGALRALEQLADRAAPGLRATATDLAALLEGLDEVRGGLAARVQAAETAEADARNDAREAKAAAQAAGDRERAALAAARDAELAKDKAERDARRAAADAERAITEAAATAADHAHARGIAESERDTAVTAREEARAAAAAATARATALADELQTVRADHDDKAARLEAAIIERAAAQQQLTEQTARLSDLAGRLQRTQAELDTVRAQAARDVQAAEEAAAHQVLQADTRRQSAEDRAERLQAELAELRTASTTEIRLLTAERDTAHRDRDTAQQAEAAQRERAVRAEAALATVQAKPSQATADDANPRHETGR
ncbi:hypothetical protein GCM10010411_75290 [Actinomadura fulvescens]|uniref:TolA protein n=1 Tax=Actinomadura fulvescens TaxID=46160 RepID=A0ABN3QIV6_9ACTN